jgi:hypothetical protein
MLPSIKEIREGTGQMLGLQFVLVLVPVVLVIVLDPESPHTWRESLGTSQMLRGSIRIR